MVHLLNGCEVEVNDHGSAGSKIDGIAKETVCF